MISVHFLFDFRCDQRQQWESFFDGLWIQHVNNVIIIDEIENGFRYHIDSASEKQFISVLCSQVSSNYNLPDKSSMSVSEFSSFIHMAVKGFLHADLYSTMAEFHGRAIGSFGLQVLI